MAIEKSLTILIPSRNEIFLGKTIENILENIRSEYTQIIAVCDGNWPDPPVADHPKVTLIHHSDSIGQRAATNEAARLSRSKYVMKCDAHCSFAEGFDVTLMEDMQDDWTMVPVMKNLHAFDWICEEGHRRYQSPSGPCTQCGKPTTRDIVWFAKNNPQSTAYLFDSEPHFQYFKDYKNRDEYKKALKESQLTETMSLQGSCWMLTREKYFELDIDSNDFGSWGSQGIEIACKTWLSGGRVVVNHRTWYGHQFRTQGGDFGFPYPISGRQVQHAKKHAREIFFNNKWSKQKRNLSWLLEKFWPLPGWTEEELNQVKANDLKHLERWNGNLTRTTAQAKAMTDLVSTSEAEPIGEAVENPALSVQVRPQRGIIYYTDNRGDHRVLEACRKQILDITKGEYEIVSASLKPLDFGKNVVLNLERSVLTMFKQILAAIEASTAEILYFTEHDVLYHPTHFDFTPARNDVFYYDENRWFVDLATGRALFYHACSTSLLVANRELLLEHYRTRVARVEKEGFTLRLGYEPGNHPYPRGVDLYTRATYFAKYPSIDIRHGKNLTPSRWSQDQFRNKSNLHAWTEKSMHDKLPGWGTVEDALKKIKD